MINEWIVSEVVSISFVNVRMSCL